MSEDEKIPEGWMLTFDERSRGQYYICLTSRHGPKVEATGSDSEEMLAWCIAGALDVDRQLRLKFPDRM
ncbi:hypothetical protein SAMN02745146_2730 [Hymenobacter daecheongensis DSM 21074]|uniref:Immunity protein 53 n=1 Tax=Hymenobacter daecheongensis DSM 21074 TaxID=1121955 RepID=A0A1M6I0I6_9BACT|nr:hypothetical protein SAMN02745146_2730 [Hymenobacter daecheongensis DSM 21074]